MFDWSHQTLQDQLANVSNSTQVIFAHPHYHNQKRIAHHFIIQPNTLYVAFVGDNLSTRDLNGQVAYARENTDETSIHTVIFDDCDHSKNTAFNDFLIQYANEHQQQTLVVISRRVPYQLLEDDDFRSRSTFIPYNPDLMLYDYTKRNSSRTLVEVRTLGSGAIHVNGRKLDQWNGILPRLLFFYLADRGMAKRDEIFTTFWSNLSTQDATNVFHVTKRKITSKLNEPFTEFEAGYYHISPNIDLRYDVILFETAIENSTTSNNNDAIRLLENAINLYRAPFLSTEHDTDHNWIIHRRDTLHKRLGEAFTMLGDHKLRLDDNEQALTCYLKALRILTYHEDIVIKAMRLYHKMGQTIDALNLYSWLEHNLQTDYSIAPSIHLQSLADTMRRNLIT